MQLGILTERGVVMNYAPMLLLNSGDDNNNKDNNGFLGILKKNNRNDKITSLIDLTKKLKKIDSLKDKK